MKLTLLQLVQRILATVDSEDVASVGDTEDSAMAVLIANRAFEYMATHSRWRHFRQYSALTSTTNLNELALPEGAYELDRNVVYYGTNRLNFLYYEDFINMTIGRDTSESNIEEISGNLIKVYNDRDPVYFSSLNDLTLVFDAIPSSVSGLTASSSRAVVYVGPTDMKEDDGDYFDLPPIAYPALELLCESFAQEDIKGDTDASKKTFMQFKSKMGRLNKEARLIDPQDDIRRQVVPRRSSRRLRGSLRYYNGGIVY